MKTRVRELMEQGNKLFTKRDPVMRQWQAIADQLYPERADFTKSTIIERDEDDMMTGSPIMARRDLADAISAMLRPRETTWFHARTLDEKVNEDTKNKIVLDWISDVMHRAMYDRRAGFIRATKQGDNDFATFGQTVIEVTKNRDITGLLFRNHHLRDTAWCENEELQVDTVHRKWKPEVRVLKRMFPATIAANLNSKLKDEPYDLIDCRHIVLPADSYDLAVDPNVRGQRRKLPFVSIYIDIENETILEECYCPRLRYVIPRWATVAGSQYAHSPGAVIAYRDARLLQQMTLTLIEAGEKTVDPPSVGTSEAIQGGVNLYPGGHTWVDAEYDERLGEALRYLPIDARGLQAGFEREKMVLEAIAKALYLDRISVPYPQGNMTATEYRGRVEEYIRRALPLFEPMEVEYNGGLCEEVFGNLTDLNAFGPPQNFPPALQGVEVNWQFDSPLQSATERAKSQAFMETANLLTTAMQLDPGVRFNVDIDKAFRDAMQGTGAPADWTASEDEAASARAEEQQRQQQAAQLAAMQQGIAMTQQAGDAGQAVAGAQKMAAPAQAGA